MNRIFNVNGDCKPTLHYMVNIESRLSQIKDMVDAGQYFTINRARQYGKTTTLRMLADYLKKDYTIVSLDFQMLSHDDFKDEPSFVCAFSNMLLDYMENIPPEIKQQLAAFVDNTAKVFSLSALFRSLSKWCKVSEKKIVLIIDEVDSASNNQVFLDFLAQLRGYYLSRDIRPAFQSVILAGVYDVKNIKKKIRPDDKHKVNSPWNIAADFDVDMSFSQKDIFGMLKEYENDNHTGMDMNEISSLLYDYTSGYPFLISRLCKLMDEKIAGTNIFPDKTSTWTKEGLLQAVKLLLSEKNTLFESLISKLNDYPELKDMVCLLLFQGQSIAYNPDNQSMDMAIMFGFVREENGTLQIANRIFETRLYNYFLTLPEVQNGAMYKLALRNKVQFIQDDQLNMECILAKFVEYFDDIYGDQDKIFYEEDGRRYFMLFLKPIINGTGNYYVEARTRNQERTDLIIDFHGQQYIIELKIWHGKTYNERGEEQLLAYLDHYHLNKGYMLSFCFNKKKKIGVKKITLGNKILIEAVV